MIAAFSRYLRARVQALYPAYVAGRDPEVEYVDGRVRVFDQRGESSYLPPHSGHLRQLATMLLLVADEIDRRRYESEDAL